MSASTREVKQEAVDKNALVKATGFVQDSPGEQSRISWNFTPICGVSESLAFCFKMAVFLAVGWVLDAFAIL